MIVLLFLHTCGRRYPITLHLEDVVKVGYTDILIHTVDADVLVLAVTAAY